MLIYNGQLFNFKAHGICGSIGYNVLIDNIAQRLGSRCIDKQCHMPAMCMGCKIGNREVHMLTFKLLLTNQKSLAKQSCNTFFFGCNGVSIRNHHHFMYVCTWNPGWISCGFLMFFFWKFHIFELHICTNVLPRKFCSWLLNPCLLFLDNARYL